LRVVGRVNPAARHRPPRPRLDLWEWNGRKLAPRLQEELSPDAWQVCHCLRRGAEKPSQGTSSIAFRRVNGRPAPASGGPGETTRKAGSGRKMPAAKSGNGSGSECLSLIGVKVDKARHAEIDDYAKAHGITRRRGRHTPLPLFRTPGARRGIADLACRAKSFPPPDERRYRPRRPPEGPAGRSGER
jgi:hypothetical protein